MKISPNKRFFEELADEVRDKIQVSAQKGEDYKGDKFDKYTSNYETKKRQGKATPKGQSIASRSTKPDLTLTGSMWRNMSAKGGKDFAEVGWTSKQQAFKVQGNIENNRIIFNEDSVHPDVEKQIQLMFKKEVRKNIKRSIPKSRTIRISK